jgi:hypothetical protein
LTEVVGMLSPAIRISDGSETRLIESGASIVRR